MMNKKGVSDTGGMVSGLILVAITLIVGMILLQASAQNVGSATNTVNLENRSLAAVTNLTAQYITDCKVLTSVKIWNATGDLLIPATNYTLTNNVVYNGNEAVRIVPAATTGAGTHYNEGVWTVDGVCQPLGYIADSGGRAIAGIIVIMFAVAIAVVALTPTLRSGVLDAMGV
jgi:hypothetical protein